MSHRHLVELHRRRAAELGPRPALRWRRHGLYHDLSWADYRARALACAAALIAAGVRPGDRVGLLAENSADWLVADLGILTAGAVNVPPHAPLTARQVHVQLRDAGVCWLFVSTAAQRDKVRAVRAELPELRGVVAFDRAAAAEDCPSWAGFLQRGRQALPGLRDELAGREADLDAGTLATVMYTSGTTGDPKGVMLTHGNLLSNAAAIHEVVPAGPDALALSWLPFSHIYSRTVDHYAALVGGETVALAESAETVVRDLADVRPTRMSSVPRFYEKLLAAVGSDDPAETGRRLRAVFGPRIEWLGCGGAPLPEAVGRAVADAGLQLLPGYGLTESSPVISNNRPGRCKLTTVGLPIPGIEVRIAPDGEVLTRGPHVMAGYWNNPGATAETIRDGWLHTGDLGHLDGEGFLSITGRKKDLLVLSNGKKVAPAQVEGLLASDPCIDQAVVYGEGRSFLTALVVPRWDGVRGHLDNGEAKLAGLPDEELAGHPRVTALLQRRIDGALADLAGWERVKKIVVLPRPFSVAADELTVSLKLRRSVVFDKHRDKLEALYRDAVGLADEGG